MGGVKPEAGPPADHGALVARAAGGTLSAWRKPPREIDVTAEVARGNVTESELEAAVTHIRQTLGQVGVVSHVGGSLNWLANGRARKLHISLLTRGGQTTIEAHEKLAPLAGVIYGGGVWGVGVFGLGWLAFIVGLNTLHSTPIALGLWGTMVAASWGATRAIYTRLVARRQRQLGSLVEDIGRGLADRTLRPDLVVFPEKRDQGAGADAPEKGERGKENGDTGYKPGGGL